LYNKLGLGTAAGLEAAEREITHAALILLGETPVPASYDVPDPPFWVTGRPRRHQALWT
jgi:hypothetical protein